MRTTLDISNDVLQAAKDRAHLENKTTGEVISELARSALNAHTKRLEALDQQACYGFRPFPRRGKIVTNALIDKLRDGEASAL